MAVEDLSDTGTTTAGRVIRLIVAKRHDQMRHPGTQNLACRADTRLMHDTRGLRKNQRIGCELKPDYIFIQPLWRIIVFAVQQDRTTAEQLCRPGA